MLLMLSTPVMALTLQQAREQGKVGETFSGYIAARSNDSETAALVAKINQARAESYRQLAAQNNVPQEDVARLAGSKLVERAKSGEYVRGVNGLWVQKH
ncbi:hypothetical protein A9B99_01075 [Mangrovibacter phragmitis]|uniref:Amine metabolic protein ydbL n=1 Tax=Mangrovibacter phragmitis TaxID=1691903 RepID=A0A1B7L7Q6_9ENTR|nr:YdbL family protein [Mangrovibacter phragmitis]OAT78358.1 hypothetical protein A9B99_01075 [Mangrovibacter phragmitis]